MASEYAMTEDIQETRHRENQARLSLLEKSTAKLWKVVTGIKTDNSWEKALLIAIVILLLGNVHVFNDPTLFPGWHP
jgi:hypothetical protein